MYFFFKREDILLRKVCTIADKEEFAKCERKQQRQILNIGALVLKTYDGLVSLVCTANHPPPVNHFFLV